MRVVRVMLAVFAVLLASVPAQGMAAQDDGGVGFEDLLGLQTTVTRTFSGDIGFDPSVAIDVSPREFGKPEVLLMMVAIFQFDTEANAASGYELLRNDMNATGFDGNPLPLTEVEVPLDIPSTAAVAKDSQATPPANFTIIVAQDGTSVLSVIAITSGAPAVTDITALTRTVAATEPGAGTGTFSADGTSTGGIWDVVPSVAAVERQFRGITSVVDAVAFGG